MNKLFLEKKYLPVTNCVNEDIRNFLTQYALFCEMQNYQIDDRQTVTFSRYGDPAMEVLLLDMQEKIEKIIDLELYPTYSYFRLYRNGDRLLPHKDRESCEISASLCLNFSYDPLSYNWPISFGGEDIIQKPGDMVIYQGCEIEHKRDTLITNDDNDWHLQVFLHYVNKNGVNSDFKFDKRLSIGMPRKKVIKPYVICIV